MEGIKTVHWKNVQGNPYRFSLHPLMVVEGGYTMLARVTLKKHNKSGSAQYYAVVFDEEYVVNFIIRRVFDKLNLLDYHDYEAIMLKAWVIWQELEKNELLPETEELPF